MNHAVLLLLTVSTGSAASPLTGFPFTDESLAYKISGPTGIHLGEAHLTAKRATAGWAFDLEADAGIPGFVVKDIYTARTNSDFCSIAFNREFAHGSHKGHEEETIERSQETVTRTTIGGGGGKSEFPASDCVKDALTMLYYARQELGQGRVPPAQQMLFGGLYDIRLVYGGPLTIPVGDKPVLTDKITGTVKGPASTFEFEMYFARDPARTPLLVKVPFAVGSFSMELVH
jgi:hypothetical protein